MHDLIHEQNSTVVRISVFSNQQSVFYDLREGESALVGQAAGCQLRISGAAPHQCLLEMRDGTLLLHNWSEGGSATVNGGAVADEVVLNFSDVVAFGEHCIRFQLRDSNSDLQPQITEEDDVLMRDAIDVSSSSDATVEPPAVTQPREVESVESSTVALLHSEISFLQNELKERDAIIDQFHAVGVGTQPRQEESTVSAERLSDLLMELQQSDARLASVTDEIRIMEELRAAESEERDQVTAWVNQIEQLVAKREAETRAEIEALKQRFEREKADRLLHQQRADDGMGGEGDAFEQLQGTLKVLRRDHELLRDKYDQATSRTSEMEKECRELRESNTEGSIEERVNEALRLERLAVSQERAQISRREHELTSKLRELEAQIENHGRLHESDARFQVFRDRLKELHEEEATEYQPPSIGKKLMNLWRSLDGPTDRD